MNLSLLKEMAINEDVYSIMKAKAISDDEYKQIIQNWKLEKIKYKPPSQRNFNDPLIKKYLKKLFNAFNIQQDENGFNLDLSKPITIENGRDFFKWVCLKNEFLERKGVLRFDKDDSVGWVICELESHGFVVNDETNRLSIFKSDELI